MTCPNAWGPAREYPAKKAMLQRRKWRWGKLENMHCSRNVSGAHNWTMMSRSKRCERPGFRNSLPRRCRLGGCTSLNSGRFSDETFRRTGNTGKNGPNVHSQVLVLHVHHDCRGTIVLLYTVTIHEFYDSSNLGFTVIRVFVELSFLRNFLFCVRITSDVVQGHLFVRGKALLQGRMMLEHTLI